MREARSWGSLLGGASFAAIEQQVKPLEARLAKDPDIEFFTAYTGAGTPRFYLSIQPEEVKYHSSVTRTRGIVLEPFVE